MSSTTARDLPPGTVVDRYAIEGPVGEGGFGSVYRARHTVLGHPVALKLLHPEHVRDEEMLQRFFREARAAASVGSPHIVKVSDCGTSSAGQPFLVMELLEGEALDDVLAKVSPIPQDRALCIGLQILEALASAHAKGIVHRDLKPGNVFLAKDPERGDDLVKLVDFGISKVWGSATGPALTRTGAVLGTPLYMAPEQFQGARDVDHRVDLYSAAALLYEMLSGRLPHTGESYAALAVQVMTDPALPLCQVAPEVPPALGEVVDRGLAREPGARWPDATSFAEALRRAAAEGASGLRADTEPVAGGQPLPAVCDGLPSAPGTERPQEPARRGRAKTGVRVLLGVGIGLVVATVLAAATVGFLFTFRASPADEEPVVTEVSPPSPPPTPAPPPMANPAAPGPAVPAPHPGAVEDPFAVAQDVLNQMAQGMLGVQPLHNPPPQQVQVGEPSIAGGLSTAAVRQVLEAARPGFERCRVAGQWAHVRAQVHVVPGGQVSLAAPAPGNPGPATAAQCCADRFREAVPEGWSPGPNGVIFFDVTLPAL